MARAAHPMAWLSGATAMLTRARAAACHTGPPAGGLALPAGSASYSPPPKSGGGSPATAKPQQIFLLLPGRKCRKCRAATCRTAPSCSSSASRACDVRCRSSTTGGQRSPPAALPPLRWKSSEIEVEPGRVRGAMRMRCGPASCTEVLSKQHAH